MNAPPPADTEKSDRRGSGAKWVLLLGLLGGAIGAAGYIFLTLSQTSSTAAIGLIATPIVFGLALVFSLVYAAAGYQLVRRPPWRTSRLASRLGWLLALVVVLSLTYHPAKVALRVARFHGLASTKASERLEDAASRYLERKDYFLLSSIARNPSTPPATLLALAQADDPQLHEKREGWIQLFDRDSLAVVRKVLRNPSMPQEVLTLLADSNNAYVLGDVAAHKQASVALLRRIAERGDSYLVHWALARNRNTPPEVVESLAASTDLLSPNNWALASNLAGNPRTPTEYLELLVDHPRKTLRYQLAHNPAIPRAIMARLAADPERYVRLGLVTNPNIDLETVEALSQPEDAGFQQYVRRAYENIGRSPCTSVATLTKLAAHPDKNIRRHAGQSPRITRALMETLAADAESRVRHRLASNPAVDEDVLRQLAEDENKSVREEARGTLWRLRSGAAEATGSPSPSSPCPPDAMGS